MEVILKRNCDIIYVSIGWPYKIDDKTLMFNILKFSFFSACLQVFGTLAENLMFLTYCVFIFEAKV